MMCEIQTKLCLAEFKEETKSEFDGKNQQKQKHTRNLNGRKLTNVSDSQTIENVEKAFASPTVIASRRKHERNEKNSFPHVHVEPHKFKKGKVTE
ncbi:hypothetical protein RUM43_009397 [Polyplax serrata]|uniref:Uncharacterized protein n=1 Tax=Polyplax serrata TaxID=468196 RepID=A0AAN8NPH1_POLSC